MWSDNEREPDARYQLWLELWVLLKVRAWFIWVVSGI